MSAIHFEIRHCPHCGLRYPLPSAHPFGTRCPHCLAETQVILKKQPQEQMYSEAARRVKPNRMGKKYAAVLDNIRSAWNVGSIFRSADGFGFLHLYLCGITPTPEQAAVRKTALGAEGSVSWSYHKDAAELTLELKRAGWNILALEEDARAQELPRASTTSKNALILGGEVCGVDPQALDLADQILYIPMVGVKRSYNVANAFAVAAYALTQQGR
ncbi:MAG: hypothetical protein Fur002_22920 [Anaerolineales bacterium]